MVFKKGIMMLKNLFIICSALIDYIFGITAKILLKKIKSVRSNKPLSHPNKIATKSFKSGKGYRWRTVIIDKLSNFNGTDSLISMWLNKVHGWYRA